jgi:hypothetical protein
MIAYDFFISQLFTKSGHAAINALKNTSAKTAELPDYTGSSRPARIAHLI